MNQGDDYTHTIHYISLALERNSVSNFTIDDFMTTLRDISRNSNLLKYFSQIIFMGKIFLEPEES